MKCRICGLEQEKDHRCTREAALAFLERQADSRGISLVDLVVEILEEGLKEETRN